MSALPPIPPNIQEFTAPMLLGGIWNWCLYGALVVQFYVYSYNFPRDNKYIKLFVYSVFSLETLQTGLSGADLYYWFGSGYGNVERLSMPYISFFDTPILGSAVSLSVQFFFVYRIWVLSKRRWWWLCILICLFSIVDAAAAFTGGVYTHVHGRFPNGRALKILALTWMGGNTISDLLIASAMLYHVIRLKAREGQLSSHALVSIVRLTIETNVVTTTVSIVSFLIIAIYPEKNWFTCPTYVLGKLYSNTLLVSLNNRISIRDTCGARGAIEIGAYASSSSRSDTTADTPDFLLLESEKQKKQTMTQPQTEVKVVRDRVMNIV